VAALLALALLATVLVLRPAVRVGSPAPALGRQPAAAAPADPLVEVPRLLAKRAKAVLARDRAAFLATVDRRRRTFYRSQATLFARMRTVPFAAFSYRLSDPRNFAGARLKRRYGTEHVFLPQVQARYRFRGHDARPVSTRYYYTFVLTPSGWRIANQGEVRRGRADVEIWDSGPVKTLRSARTMVVFHQGSETLARRLLRAAERAYGQVAAVWRSPWERKAVILVPRDEAEGERLVGRDLSRVAALVQAQSESGPTERMLGNRLVVNSSKLARYDDLNLQLVVTHELTHVATYTLGDGVPLYLVEGLAEYVALRPLGLSLALSRPALAAQVRSGRFAGTLPTEGELLGRDTPAAYDTASSFCQWVADVSGEAKLLALYRTFAGPSRPTTAELDRGFRRILGISRRTAERRWAAWVSARL
jgi:hypothetical protein